MLADTICDQAVPLCAFKGIIIIGGVLSVVVIADDPLFWSVSPSCTKPAVVLA